MENLRFSLSFLPFHLLSDPILDLPFGIVIQIFSTIPLELNFYIFSQLLLFCPSGYGR